MNPDLQIRELPDEAPIESSSNVEVPQEIGMSSGENIETIGYVATENDNVPADGMFSYDTSKPADGTSPLDTLARAQQHLQKLQALNQLIRRSKSVASKRKANAVSLKKRVAKRRAKNRVARATRRAQR